MTLVIAQKTEDQIFLLSDTFSENEKTATQYNWFVEPLVKIVKVNEEFVVAYSGNSEVALECLKSAASIHSDDMVAHFLDSHLLSKDDGSIVEYIAVNSLHRLLFSIKNGIASQVDMAYIGSQSGFAKFRQYQARIGGPRSNEETVIEIRRAINGLSERSTEKFNEYFSAFKETLLVTDGTYGGLLVPYVIAENFCGYLPYLINHRGEVSSEETSHQSPHPLSFQDQTRGAFSASFWGTDEAFAAYYFYGASGVVYSGLDISGIECELISKIDGYDFVGIAEAKGCGEGVFSMWNSWQNDLSKVGVYFGRGEKSKSELMLKSVCAQIEKKLGAMNEGRVFDFGDNIHSNASDAGAVVFDIEAINMLTAYSERKVAFYNASGNAKMASSWSQELVEWKATIGQLKFQLNSGRT